MPAKKDDFDVRLKKLIGNRDMDDVVYRLVEIACERRNEADEGTNKEEQRHQQFVVSTLLDCQRKLEETE